MSRFLPCAHHRLAPRAAAFALGALLLVGCAGTADAPEAVAPGAQDAASTVPAEGAQPTDTATETPADAPGNEAGEGDGADVVPTAATEDSPADLTVADVSLTLPAGIADEVALEMAPGMGVDPTTGGPTGEGPEWTVAPAHVEGTFPGYPITDARHSARLRIYDTTAYTTAQPGVATVIARLKPLIGAADLGSSSADLPLLPPYNAMPLLQSRLERLSFADGEGIRFLSMYGQAQMPLTNEELFYTFQGLSTDGSRYVSLILPVRTEALPDQIDLASWTFPADYEVYAADTTKVLDELAPSEFTPNLDALDAMVAGLGVMGAGE